MKFAAIQLCSQGEVAANLAQAEQLVSDASRNGAVALLLPEAFSYLGPEEGRSQTAEALATPGPIQEALSSWCRRYDVYLIAGGFPELSADPRRPYNTCVVFDRQGLVKSSYRKIHLFDACLSDGTRYSESDTTLAGSEPVIASLQGFLVGLSICYDLRFPAHFSQMREQGAQVLMLPAAFTESTGEAHWEVLLRARAIENQCWVVAAAQVGEHPGGRRTHGHSMIVTPWGEVIAEVPGRQPGFVCAELSLGAVETIRMRMPMSRRDSPL